MIFHVRIYVKLSPFYQFYHGAPRICTYTSRKRERERKSISTLRNSWLVLSPAVYVYHEVCNFVRMGCAYIYGGKLRDCLEFAFSSLLLRDSFPPIPNEEAKASI